MLKNPLERSTTGVFTLHMFLKFSLVRNLLEPFQISSFEKRAIPFIVTDTSLILEIKPTYTENIFLF